MPLPARRSRVSNALQHLRQRGFVLDAAGLAGEERAQQPLRRVKGKDRGDRIIIPFLIVGLVAPRPRTVRRGRRPVSSAPRVGVHVGCEYAEVSLSPAAAAASRFGVGEPTAALPPKAPRSPHPTSSVKNTRTAWAGAACEARRRTGEEQSAEQTHCLAAVRLAQTASAPPPPPRPAAGAPRARATRCSPAPGPFGFYVKKVSASLDVDGPGKQRRRVAHQPLHIGRHGHRGRHRSKEENNRLICQPWDKRLYCL